MVDFINEFALMCGVNRVPVAVVRVRLIARLVSIAYPLVQMTGQILRIHIQAMEVHSIVIVLAIQA